MSNPGVTLLSHAAEQAAMAIYGLAKSNGALGGLDFLVSVLDTISVRVGGSLWSRINGDTNPAVSALASLLRRLEPGELTDEDLLLQDANASVDSQVFSIGRLRYLLKAAPALQRAHGQLYPDEAAELDVIVKALSAPGVAVAIERGTASVETKDQMVRLAVLHDWATPWGRFWRRDREAVERMEQYLESLANHEDKEVRDQHALLVCIKTGVGDAVAKAGARAHVDRQLASLVSQLEFLDEQQAQLELQRITFNTQREALIAKRDMLV